MQDTQNSLERNLLKISNNNILNPETKQELARVLELHYQSKNTIN